jgi:hypothetical protein
VTLDFSGWNVAWNAIPSISMGAGAWLGNPDGVAIMTCVNSCKSGATLVLDYSATVPPDDASGYGARQRTNDCRESPSKSDLDQDATAQKAC